jgi:hypothetical protein
MTRIRGDALDGDDRAAESTRLQAETGISMLKGTRMPPPPICCLRTCAHTCSSSLRVCTSRCTKETKHFTITPSSCLPLGILIESQAKVVRLFVMSQPLFVHLNDDHSPSHSPHAPFASSASRSPPLIFPINDVSATPIGLGCPCSARTSHACSSQCVCGPTQGRTSLTLSRC